MHLSTSFTKKTNARGRSNLPPGTKTSLHNNQLLISTGIPSLDALIGGGLAVGSLILVEEDKHGSYAQVLQRLFIAQGVANQHPLFIGSADQFPLHILKDTPPPLKEEGIASADTSDNYNDLTIAWRYKNTPKLQTPSSGHQFGHYFDLSQHISEERLKQIQCVGFQPKDTYYRSNKSKNIHYKMLLESIRKTIKQTTEGLNKSTPILRISLHSLGSPHWCETLISFDEYDPSLSWFLLALRSLLRNSLSACMVSIPTHLFEEDAFTSRLEHCCDTVVRLESFAGSTQEQNLLYKEYHGLFHVVKVARLNSISEYNIDTSDLAFKLKRKKFSIEKMHIPPNISVTASRSSLSNENSRKSGAPLCSSMAPINNLLDF